MIVLNTRSHQTLTATFATIFVIASVASFPEQCIENVCFETPGSDVRRDFEGAKSWCSEKSSQLAAVTDGRTQQMLTQFLLNSQLNEPAFINIRIYEHQTQTTSFLVNGKQYYGGILNQENKLLDYALYASLIYDSVDMKMNSSNPNEFRNYICNFTDASLCLNNSRNSYDNNGICYIKYNNEVLTWYEARERCQNYGGDLATFNYANDSYKENYRPPINTSWLNTSLTYWVGVRWDKWFWKSPECGDELIYTSWSSGKPNNIHFQCVCVDPYGSPSFSWVDCDCDSLRQFICLKIGQTNTALTTGTSKHALTEPQRLSEAMLVGLVLGIGVNLPLLIIILILVIFIVRQKRQFREKKRNNRRVKTTATTSSQVDLDISTPRVDNDDSVAHIYQHLRRQTIFKPGTTMQIYD